MLLCSRVSPESWTAPAIQAHFQAPSFGLKYFYIHVLRPINETLSALIINLNKVLGIKRLTSCD